MKFDAVSLVAILALPAAAQACELKIQWTTNWYENALRRYQVQLITTPRNDNHLNVFCRHLRNNVRGAHANVQCYWSGDRYVADASLVQGPAGYDAYLQDFNEAADGFQGETGCRTIRNL